MTDLTLSGVWIAVVFAVFAFGCYFAVRYRALRSRLSRFAEFARQKAIGANPPVYRDSKEPFQSLIADIQSLTSRVEEGSQSSIEEKNRLFAILESMTEGVLVVDTEQKVLLLNSALTRAFSFKKDQALGMSYWEVFRDPGINEMIRAALSGKRADKKELATLLSESIFEIQISPVFTGDDFLGVVAVFRDITMMKEFERLRAEFVANVSHELKTPLTSILGFVETLREGAVEDPENRLKFLQIIETQSKQLHALIEDLLLLSRVESSNEPLKLESFELAGFLDKMKEVFTPLIKEKKLVWKTELSPKDLKISAEPSSFGRALSNLLDNAVKYNRSDGQITVKAIREGGSVKIQVSDTGCGILPADLPRIFERFYRADKSRSRELGGSGLGLSIAKHIVERHSGRLEARSIPQEGSTFTLTLPS